MSTTVAIAAGSNVVALSALSKANKSECRRVIDAFDSATASKQEMIDYAKCVDLLMDAGLTTNEIKIVIVYFMVCIVCGVIYGHTLAYYKSKNMLDNFFCGFMGMFTGFLIGIVFLAIHFLITA